MSASIRSFSFCVVTLLSLTACGDNSIVSKLDVPAPAEVTDATTTRAMFDRLDTDGDGRVTAAELRAGAMAFDNNGDRALQADEAPGIVAAADKDGDGVATPAELASADWQKLIDQYGQDGKGLSYQDFANATGDGTKKVVLWRFK